MIKKITLLLLILFFVACGSQEVSKKKKDSSKSVKVIPIEKKLISKSNISSGIIEPINEVTVITPTGGTIEKINYKNGDFVKAGSVIVLLDDKSAIERYLKAKASFSSSSVNYESKKIRYEKMKQLRAEKLISEDEILNEKMSFTQSESNFEAAKAEYLAASENYTDLTAKTKIDGLVTDMDLKLYQKIPANKAIFTIVNDKKLYIKTGVSPQEIADLKVGNTAILNIEGISQPYSGKVVEINPVADKESKKYQVKIEVDNSKKELKKGMYAKVKVESGEKEALVVPKDSLILKDLLTYVYIVKNGEAEEIEVEKGYESGNFVEITSDKINEKDLLVIEGQYLLENKDKVKILK